MMSIGRFVFGIALGLMLPAVTDAERVPLPPPASASIGWPSYNNDVGSGRYAGIGAIDRTNVRGLHVKCSASLGSQPDFQNGPVVIGSALFTSTSTQTVAIDATNCKRLWTHGYAGGSGLTNRGVAVANGLVFRGYADGHVIAIDAVRGTTVWNTRAIANGSREFIDAAPIVWKSSLIIGTANGEYGQACHVLALDQRTGKILWSAQTVPNVGSSAAATWRGATRIAGGATWTSFTIDAATGALYVPVGNPGPDYDVRDRLGSNLYTNAVLELDVATGKFTHALQTVPQDAHDWDQAATPAVVTLASGTKVALIAGKDGYLRAVDLRTYVQRWRTPVTTISNAAAPIVTTGTHFCPSGGVLWNGAAFSPATGLAYVNAVDSCRTVYLEAKPVPYVAGKAWLGSANVVRDAAQTGWLNAIDASSGATVWRYHSTGALIAGVTATAGGLVLSADVSGDVLAFHSGTGALLAKVATGLPVGGGVISYAVAGTQYVAVAGGLNSSEFDRSASNSAIVILGL